MGWAGQPIPALQYRSVYARSRKEAGELQVPQVSWYNWHCCGSGSAWIRIKLKGWTDPDPHHSDKLDPDLDPNQFADDRPQCMVYRMSLFEHFFQVLNLFWKVMRIRNVDSWFSMMIVISVTSLNPHGSESSDLQDPDPGSGSESRSGSTPKCHGSATLVESQKH